MNRIVFSAVLISCSVLFSCKPKQPPPNPPTPVNLFAVKKQQVLYYDEYPGTTTALSQVNILPEVQGYITGIFFTEGTEVHKGQKLYEIDRQLYQQAYDAAVANLKVAEGNHVEAKQDADRYEYLNNQNAVAKQTLDHAVITLDNSVNQEKAAAESVKTALTNLNYSIVYAPFDGTIGLSQVKLGNVVTVGQTVLNTISTNNPMAVDFLINEKQLEHFENLETNKQESIDSLFTIQLPDNTIYPYTGKISVIDRAVDPQTGTITIRLVFPNPQNVLRAGMNCIVRVHNQEAAPQMVIPNKAVVEQMGEYFVFVAKDTVIENSDSTQKNSDSVQTPKLRAFQQKIQLGQTIGPNIIVVGGLNVGDKIVTDGLQALHDGSAISATNKHAQTQNDSTGKSPADSSKNKPGS